MAHELLLNGQHGYPTVLLENGFNFQYPALEKALKMAVGFDKHH
jgi:NAD dependent epimerase/dehydratase family enzyme